MPQVQLAKAHASAVAAESRETAMSEALKEAEDRHIHQLREAYLVTRAKLHHHTVFATNNFLRNIRVFKQKKSTTG